MHVQCYIMMDATSMCINLWCQVSEIGIVTGVKNVCLRNHCHTSGSGKEFISSPKLPEWQWSSSSLVFSVCQGQFPRG